MAEVREKVSRPATDPATIAPAPQQPSDSPQATQYWIGLTADCPYDYMTVGGVTFHKRTELVSDERDASGQTQRIPQKGQVVPLEPDQIARVREAAASHVIRMTGVRPLKYSKTDTRFRADRSDVPVGRFIYMQPATPAQVAPAIPDPKPIA